MILVDTSVWVDHLRKGDEALKGLLSLNQVLSHPFVVGELALGHIEKRAAVLGALQNLPQALVATEDEVLHMIEKRELSGFGIGLVDAHLLAAVQLTSGALLWTRDKRLSEIAAKNALAFRPA